VSVFSKKKDYVSVNSITESRNAHIFQQVDFSFVLLLVVLFKFIFFLP
jgi:hypothetical protein